jgi:hypothetical protein
MSTSMRYLFTREGIASSAGQGEPEIISLRNSLANHFQGLEIGLREANRRFLTAVGGDGFARGCHRRTRPGDVGKMADAVPSWVSVHDHETRTVEGVLAESRVTHSDLPLRPWHTYYDWNFFVRVDKQYQYLLSESNLHDHGGNFECEWDTAFLPDWAWPQVGNRIWMVGRWIYDCGHPDAHGHKTEIHPPKAVASFRTEATQFAANSGPTRANNAVLYIGSNGGYWRQPINDQDYPFDLYLPPKPYPEAGPVWKITPQTSSLPIQPRIMPYPSGNPRALRVVVPLRGVEPPPEEYGAIISGGWSDPRGTETAQVERARVTITKIYMDGDYDYGSDEWHVYVGVNGRWGVWRNLSGWEQPLNLSVDLDLHSTDQINITACGFEADVLHDYMGDDSGYSWEQISDPNLTVPQKEAIEDSLLWQLSSSFNDENDPIGYFATQHGPTERGTFEKSSENPRGYRLRYIIEGR